MFPTTAGTSNPYTATDLEPLVGPSDVSTQLTTLTTAQATPKCVDVLIEGVPIKGIVDSGSDITILSGSAFQKLVSTCKLDKEQLKPPDKKACTYGYHPLKLRRCTD